MKKRVLAVLLASAMVLSLAACGNSSKSSDSEKSAKTEESDAKNENAVDTEDEEAWKKEPMYGKTLPYAYNGGNCVGACKVAELFGFYEEEGLKVECISGTNWIDNTATGKAVMCESHIAQMAVPIINGLDMVLVGTAQTGCQSLYVVNDSSYQKTSDLVGKNVGIPNGFGSMDHNIVLRFMGHDGLDASDYNFKVVEVSAVVQALQSGELDASLLPDQFAYQFVANGTLRTIRSLTTDDDFKEEPCCAVALNKKFAEENPITAKKLTRAIAKASGWIDTHTEESVDLMLDNKMMSASDLSLIDKLYELQGSYDWTVTDAQAETTLRSIIDDYKGFGLIDSSLDTDKTLNSIWWPLVSDDELEEVWAAGKDFDASSLVK